MSSPMVSVVMSVFNGEPFLSQAIESILTQTFSDFDFIIIDDGSTDNTRAILDKYRRLDSRIRLNHQENLGLVEALNRGCALSSSKYIARMDADDISLPGRLLAQVSCMESHPGIAVLGAGVEMIDLHSNSSGVISVMPTDSNQIKAALTRDNVLWHPTVMMRSVAFNKVGGYRRVTDAEDYDLWLRIVEHSRIANLPEVLVKYRLHPQQISCTHRSRQILGALAAQTSAAYRQNNEPDPLDRFPIISQETLLSWGLSTAVLHTTLARGYLTWVRNMYVAREYTAALDMAKVLLSSGWNQADRWILAEAYLFIARSYWRSNNTPLTAIYLARAVFTRPILLGRPLRVFAGSIAKP